LFIYYFHNQSSASGGLTPAVNPSLDPTEGLNSSRPFFCSSLEKILQAPMSDRPITSVNLNWASLSYIMRFSYLITHSLEGSYCNSFPAESINSLWQCRLQPNQSVILISFFLLVFHQFHEVDHFQQFLSLGLLVVRSLLLSYFLSVLD